MTDYNSDEYQNYLKEERARRKAGLAARKFEPKPSRTIGEDQGEPIQVEPDDNAHKFYRYNYRDSGGAG